MLLKRTYDLHKKQILGLIFFGCFIIIFQMAFSYYKWHQKEDLPKISFFSENENPLQSIVLNPFNPNDLDHKQWENLGFTDREIAIIFKYKKMIGGSFTSKNQFKKCYPIVNRFTELEPYVLLPENNSNAYHQNYFQPNQKKKLLVGKPFNPDFLSLKDWVNLGFSENQAQAILKYKTYLGGSFQSKDHFKACFIISEENYKQLSPYLLLPEHVEEAIKGNNVVKIKPNLQNFDPNLLDIDGWKTLGFSDKQAQVIVNYRDKNLKGSFKTLEDVQRCFVISEDKYIELKPFIKLNPENFKSNNSTIYKDHTTEQKKPTEEKTNFSKTDLNTITYKQLVEFGFDEKSAAVFIGFRNKLGGYVNKEQILEIYDVDKVKLQQLVTASPLITSNVKKYTLLEAPEDWLKNHPYFKYSADKIIYFRISNPDEKKIWKFLKLKPETEAKMKLYLK